MAGPVFTSEQIDVMHATFKSVCRKLRIRPGEREADQIAVMIVDLAATGALDVAAITATMLLATEEVKPIDAVQRLVRRRPSL
jgi:hypothetical protein